MFIQLGEAALIIVLSIGLGGLPLVGWVVRAVSGKDLSRQGTGNVSVAAAFQQTSVPVGVLAALAEAAKGIAVVLLARAVVPQQPAWELLALAGLVVGRYRYGGSAGSTNVAWGLLIHAPFVTAITAVIGGLGYALIRRPGFWQYAVLGLFCGGLAVRYADQPVRVGAAIALAALLAYIYRQLANDLTPGAAKRLDQPLDAEQVGQKAATLADLKQAGYPVTEGWAIAKGDHRQPLLDYLNPSQQQPLIVRSSAAGEDQMGASAAGQYATIAGVTDRKQLEEAIETCFASYDQPSAVQYRQDRGLSGSAMAALIQQQVSGQFSGVAFSRDPVAQEPQVVLVEGLPGGADQVVSGEATPERYRVRVQPADLQTPAGQMPADLDLAVEGEGELPESIVQPVAYLARQVERHYHGVPQDIEWTYDGEQLWLLQARPITTLLPIWTRKIASEVLPGVIHPLTWSINQPITCGVWGDLFTVMLKSRSHDLDFDQTATLHYSHTYFNASLLGHIFERLGLPPESLEFLTLGESFSPPSPATLVRNLPGLGRMLGREWRLERDFQQDCQNYFHPELQRLRQQSVDELSLPQLQQRIEALMAILSRATYYNILAPLSESLRQALLPVDETELDYRQTPEVEALRSLQDLARQTRQWCTAAAIDLPLNQPGGTKALLNALASHPEGETILEKLHDIIETHGYLSESATDIAVPTWREHPRPAQNLFAQFVQNPPRPAASPDQQTWLARQVQRRIELKGQVARVYNSILAELRYSFLAVARRWHPTPLGQVQDIFLLSWDQIRQALQQQADWSQLQSAIQQRQAEIVAHQELSEVPPIVYGHQAPPPESLVAADPAPDAQLRGIGASAGQVEGQIKVVKDWQNLPQIDRDTILTVPYTDAGWAPLLAQAGGLISEAGGRLSHGAIVAREYGIPAVMNLAQATQRLKDGQRVRLYGRSGRVELLEDKS